MRKKIVAGNWKMNKTFSEAIDLTNEIKQYVSTNNVIQSRNDLEIFIAPPFPYLPYLKTLISGVNKMKIAAQNCYSEDKGAFTGEVAAPMLHSCGVDGVIIGHSERRNYFKETDTFLAAKIVNCLKHQLTPIFCCGEVLDERNAKKHFDVVGSQIVQALFHLNAEDFQKIIIAYEPVWAIGTGVNATAEQAQEMHKFIRTLIAEKYGQSIANDLTILYGGSCNAKNARELFANPDVDGGLIGGASLIAKDFIEIILSLPAH